MSLVIIVNASLYAQLTQREQIDGGFSPFSVPAYGCFPEIEKRQFSIFILPCVGDIFVNVLAASFAFSSYEMPEGYTNDIYTYLIVVLNNAGQSNAFRWQYFITS